jgi:hypothetical protein
MTSDTSQQMIYNTSLLVSKYDFTGLGFFYLAPGKTTVHLWDDKGNSTGINLTVANTAKLGSDDSHPASASPDAQRPSSDDTSRPAEIEYWTESKKDVFTVPRSKSAK